VQAVTPVVSQAEPPAAAPTPGSDETLAK